MTHMHKQKEKAASTKINVKQLLQNISKSTEIPLHQY